MVTAAQCYKKYGIPEKEAFMRVITVPDFLRADHVPVKIYCNRDMEKPLLMALSNLHKEGYIQELKTWDGCFNIRKKRGGFSASLHSWGIAVDINAAWNPFGKPPRLSDGFVKCWKEAGFDWGGEWKRPDGMHFQLAKLP